MDASLIAEISLIFITLVAAVIGTASNPPPRVKGFLIGLAFLASIGSLAKAYSDNEDKLFIKSAVGASLSPTTGRNGTFTSTAFDVLKVSSITYVESMHTQDGMAFIGWQLADGKKIPDKDDAYAAVVVVNAYDLSTMMANEITTSWLKGRICEILNFDCMSENTKFLGELRKKEFNPEAKNQPEELQERIGILGEAIFRIVAGFNADCYYSDSDGSVRIQYTAASGAHSQFGLQGSEIKNLQKEMEEAILTRFAER